jgi:hypothetical protein
MGFNPFQTHETDVAEILKLVKNQSISLPQRVHLKDERLFLPGGWAKPLIRPLKDAFAQHRVKS